MEPDYDKPDSCSCHISAPCSYCTDTNYCEDCDTVTWEDECPDCGKDLIEGEIGVDIKNYSECSKYVQNGNRCLNMGVAYGGNYTCMKGGICEYGFKAIDLSKNCNVKVMPSEILQEQPLGPVDDIIYFLKMKRKEYDIEDFDSCDKPIKAYNKEDIKNLNEDIKNYIREDIEYIESITDDAKYDYLYILNRLCKEIKSLKENEEFLFEDRKTMLYDIEHLVRNNEFLEQELKSYREEKQEELRLLEEATSVNILPDINKGLKEFYRKEKNGSSE